MVISPVPSLSRFPMAKPGTETSMSVPSGSLSPMAAKLLARAQRELQSGDADAAMRTLARLPEDADIHIGLGVALYRIGMVDEALTHLRRACELAPESSSAWYNLAEALKPQVCTMEAIEALRRTLALDPSHVPALLALARAQASVGQVAAAAASFRAILCREPENAEVWFALSNLKTVTFDAQ